MNFFVKKIYKIIVMLAVKRCVLVILTYLQKILNHKLYSTNILKIEKIEFLYYNGF